MALIKHAQSHDIARDAIVLDLGSIRQEGAKLRAHAEAQAQQIIEQAHQERERLVSDAHETGFAQGLAKGLDAGTEQGRIQGKAEALTSHHEKLDSLTRTLQKMLDACQESRELLSDLAREDVLRFAITVAQRVTKRAVELDPQSAVQQLDAALSLVLNPSRLRIVVHPQDAQTIRDALPDLMQRFSTETQTELLEDDSLPTGSAVVRTEQGTVEANVELQLERIIDLVRPGSVGNDNPQGAP